LAPATAKFLLPRVVLVPVTARQQAGSQDFTLGWVGGGTDATRVHFFLKKLTFFSRHPQTLSWPRTKQAIRPNKAIFLVKMHPIDDWGPPAHPQLHPVTMTKKETVCACPTNDVV